MNPIAFMSIMLVLGGYFFIYASVTTLKNCLILFFFCSSPPSNGRNERGREMLSLVENLLEITPTISSGARRPFVMETVKADDDAKLGRGPSQPASKFIGNLIAFVLNLIGPKGLEFARYSLDYHTIRNYLYVNRTWGKERADRHMPSYAKKIVDMYDKNGEISQMLSNK
ncbi:hypothetical protein L1049_017161 [Liquidambar formosana]|uniref:Uncharacterized protein n=1 Tax=Liquidambar formosana TaxID=63359 RepID=A0AAP0X788_LIQFO